MLVMLELWTRVHWRSMHPLPEGEENISSSKEQLTEIIMHKKFTDFEFDHFWRWTT